MYEDRPPLQEGHEPNGLEQGDILEGVLVPAHVTGASFVLRRDGSGLKWTNPQLPPAEILAGEKEQRLREMSKVARQKFCIVLSNSCDNSDGNDLILLAQVRPFEFLAPTEIDLREQLRTLVDVLVPLCTRKSCSNKALRRTSGGDSVCDTCPGGAAVDGAVDLPHASIVRSALAEARSAADSAKAREAANWTEISRAGTGHGKYFYLPEHPNAAIGFERAEADLAAIFAVTPSYLKRCLAELGATRLFGLTPEAVRHLERSIDFRFARHPRNDHAWPSEKDLALKLVWLEMEIARGSARQHQNEAERDEIKRLLPTT